MTESLFNMPTYKIQNKIRLIELFAGVGSQAMALRDIGADFEHYKVVEFDKYAIKSYNAIHGTDFKPIDITQMTGSELNIVDTDKYTYIMTYSFPCQDLSIAGKQKGMSKGDGTRSGLLWEVERLLNETEQLPHVLLMENVPQVHGKKNLPDFEKWLQFLESKGYRNYWKDLKATGFGVPQNRTRCFCVSILNADCDFAFPVERPAITTMKQCLEENVDEKYYINSEKAQELVSKLIADGVLPQSGTKQVCVDLTVNEPRKIEVANCIVARTDRGISNYRQEGSGVVEIIRLGNIFDTETKKCSSQAGRVYDEKGLSPTLGTMQGGRREPIILETVEDYRLRKLTPKECWRLMGFSDDDFEKAAAVNSNTQLYKQAGNSIVKPVLMSIFDKIIGLGAIHE